MKRDKLPTLLVPMKGDKQQMSLGLMKRGKPPMSLTTRRTSKLDHILFQDIFKLYSDIKITCFDGWINFILLVN